MRSDQVRYRRCGQSFNRSIGDRAPVGVNWTSKQKIQRILYRPIYHHLFAQSTLNSHVQQYSGAGQQGPRKDTDSSPKKKHDKTVIHFTINQHYK